MTDRIEPALSAEEWARWTTIPHWMEDQVAEACAAINDTEQGTPAKLIALANAALPDSDPRKITREIVEQLRSTRGEYLDFSAFGDALESYLPPEQP